MHIIWQGQSCFQIIAGQIKIVIDPFSEDIGLKLSKLEADILLVSHDHYDHANIKAIPGDPFLIKSPGEYEVKGVFVQGIPAFHDDKEGKERGKNTIYIIEAEELRLCHLGDLGQKELSADQLDKIGEVDILLAPVGGIYTIDAKEAAKIISQIEPKIVIPMHYDLPKLNPPAGGVKLDGVDKFLKEMGQKSAETQPKLIVKKKDLVEEETKVIVLQA